jgi:hypothetical protein
MQAIHFRLVVTLAAGIAVLALDAVIPRGVATWLLQIAVVWTAMSWASRRELMVVGLWCAACADAGYWLSGRGGPTRWFDFFNQLLCIAAIFMLVHIGLKERAAQAARRAAEAEVRVLRGLLPICAECKKIRNEKNDWEQMEVYIHRHSEAQFTHGLCPECAEKWAEA